MAPKANEIGEKISGAVSSSQAIKRAPGMLESYLLGSDKEREPMTDEEREQIAGPSFVSKNGGGGK